MKKLLLIFTLCSIISYSQLLRSYTAEAGLNTAVSSAEDQLTDPVLRAIVANSGLTIDAGEQFGEIEIFFDFESGESNVFAYIFSEGNDINDGVLIPVVSIPLLGFVDATTLTGDIGIPFEELSDLVTQYRISEEWLDSDVFAENITNFSDYGLFLEKYPAANAEIIALITDGEESSATQGETFWGVQYRDENETDLFFCAMNANNENMFCDESIVGSVFDLAETNAEIGPNPAKDYIEINYENFSSINEIVVYDIFGNQIAISSEISSDGIRINTNNLNLGTYFVKIKSSSKNYITKFIKSE